MDYYDFLRGKSVALVGPAASTESLLIGEKIDGFDVICRVGEFAVPLAAKEVGSRTDVVYTSFYECSECGYSPEDMVDEWEWCGCQWICDTHGTQFEFFDAERIGKERGIRSRRIPSHLTSLIQSPTRGFNAIVDLKNSCLKSLFVVGFTFGNKSYRKDIDVFTPAKWDFKTDYPKSHKSHNYRNELKYFCEMIDNDDRISADPILKDIIESSGFSTKLR